MIDISVYKIVHINETATLELGKTANGHERILCRGNTKTMTMHAPPFPDYDREENTKVTPYGPVKEGYALI